MSILIVTKTVAVVWLSMPMVVPSEGNLFETNAMLFVYYSFFGFRNALKLSQGIATMVF